MLLHDQSSRDALGIICKEAPFRKSSLVAQHHWESWHCQSPGWQEVGCLEGSIFMAVGLRFKVGGG